MSKIPVGIVGTGFGAIVHAPSYRAHERFEPLAIASPNRATQVARELGIPHAFASTDEMLRALPQLEAISVASPPFAHYEAALAAIEAGKHVLCEKPFALDVAQAERLLAASKRHNRAYGIAFEFRFDSSRQALKELVDNGHLEPRREIEFTHMWTTLRAENTSRKRGWWFERSRGGGIIQAIGSHMIDSVCWLAGRDPVAVTGFSRTANPMRRDDAGTFESDVADGMFALLDFGEGLVGRIALDGTNAVNTSSLAVFGENRIAVATAESLAWAKLFTIEGDESSELELAKGKYDHLRAAQPNIPLFMHLLDEFAAAIDGKPNALPTFEDGLRVQRVMRAVGYEDVTGSRST
ncbi:MAG: Gfo/Idh/MocA family oxidoreductase [Candidatus Eremiobacteraeota bacterium]|nr:Gfo/Idh/MocA family oxidoreductase [Candidatus Eremiobacteraeota bacterium]